MIAERGGAARSLGRHRRKPRLLYAAGPGDVLGSYEQWRQGLEDSSQVVVTYSSQFYEVCDRLDCDALILVRREGPRRVRRGRFTFSHRPNRLVGRGPVLHHLGQLLYGMHLTISAVRFGADVVVVCEGTTHWFMLRLLQLVGVAVVPSIHSLLWLESEQPSPPQRLLNALAKPLFARPALAILTASNRIAEQVNALSSGRPAIVRRFLPFYREALFRNMKTPEWDTRPFSCLYVGRIEESKGVFDLLVVADRLNAQGRAIEFDLCGDGTALESLQAEIESRDLGGMVRCHGHCSRSAMREMYERSHVVIAPTRSTLVEGFNQVVVEAALAGRPVVTSWACPAMEYVKPAVVEACADDPGSYADALARLMDDQEFYEFKRRACECLREPFLDPRNSWGAVLEKTLLEALPDRFRRWDRTADLAEESQADAPAVVKSASR